MVSAAPPAIFPPPWPSLDDRSNHGHHRCMARRLTRSKTDRKIAGICGGVAEFFGIDSTTVRVLWVIAGIIPGGWGVLPYIVLWIVLPEEDEVRASPAVSGAEERCASSRSATRAARSTATSSSSAAACCGANLTRRASPAPPNPLCRNRRLLH